MGWVEVGCFGGVILISPAERWEVKQALQGRSGGESGCNELCQERIENGRKPEQVRKLDAKKARAHLTCRVRPAEFFFFVSSSVGRVGSAARHHD